MAPGAARERETQQKKRKRDGQMDQQQLQGALPPPWPAWPWPWPPVCGTKSALTVQNSSTSLFTQTLENSSFPQGEKVSDVGGTGNPVPAELRFGI